MNPYESEKLVAEYLLLHYGKPGEVCPWPFVPEGALDFPKRLVSEFPEFREQDSSGHALEVGCATGRTCLELSRNFSSVEGIDFSQAFIDAAKAVQSAEISNFNAPGEGDSSASFEITRDQTWKPDRVNFQAGDACSLPEFDKQFEVLVGANLICRLPEPDKFLARLPELVVPEGLLLVTSPYTWLDEFTPRKHWLGGYEENGRQVRTLDTLQKQLEDDFTLLRTKDMPFMIREHSRKFQWSVTEASLWRRKA